MEDWAEVGDGVWVRHYESLSLNVGVVRGGEGLLVIDTRAHHAQARELRADLARLSPLPVHWVVNTHHHWDHTFGNGEFAGAAIWGHERCRARLRDEGEQTRDRLRLAYGPEAAPLFDEVVITPPDHTFEEAVTIRCGDRAVEVRHLGLGHTDNDVVVTAGGVVFTGDLLEEGAPPAYDDAFPLEWPATVRRLLDLVSGTVVPGHGAAVDRAFAAAQAGEIAAVAGLAVERHAAGMPVEEAARRGGPFPEQTLRSAFRRAWEHLDRGDPVP